MKFKKTMGYYGRDEGLTIGDILRLFLFFLGLVIFLGGMFGGSALPSDLALIPEFLNNTFWRLVSVVVGLILMIFAINPDAISGKVGLSVSR